MSLLSKSLTTTQSESSRYSILKEVIHCACTALARSITPVTLLKTPKSIFTHCPSGLPATIKKTTTQFL